MGQEKTVGRNGTDKEQGHQARADSAPLPVFTWLPLLEKCERAAWHTRHSAAQIWHSDIHPRLLLARTQRQPHAALQRGILGGQNKPKPQPRRAQQVGTAANGMESDDRVGMPAAPCRARTDATRNRIPNQSHLPATLPQPTVHTATPLRHFTCRRAHDANGRRTVHPLRQAPGRETPTARNNRLNPIFI